MTPRSTRRRLSHDPLLAYNVRLRACRRCHLAGFLDDRQSIPIARDPEPDAPLPEVLLVGQAPGLRATSENRPFAGAAGERLRDWLEQGGIPRSDFFRRVHFAAITRCYPGRCQAHEATASPRPVSRRLAAPGSTS